MDEAYLNEMESNVSICNTFLTFTTFFLKARSDWLQHIKLGRLHLGTKWLNYKLHFCRQNGADDVPKEKSKSESQMLYPKYTYDELVHLSSDLAKGDIDLDYKVTYLWGCFGYLSL